jgi:hypothetical protein
LVAEWTGRVCVLENGTVSAGEQRTRYVGVPHYGTLGGVDKCGCLPGRDQWESGQTHCP